MNSLILTVIFLVSTIIGYYLIKNVPTLLHTPLMSGMNALSGLTVLGALVTSGIAVSTHNRILGGISIILAMINVAGGFGVTMRMLKMFKKNKSREKQSNE